MIPTLPLEVTHRDYLKRVIRNGDIVVHTNHRQSSGYTIATVRGAGKVQVKLTDLTTGEKFRSYPRNLIVLTQQVEKNMEGNVGANIDLEATR